VAASARSLRLNRRAAFLFIRTLTGAVEIYYRTPDRQIFHLQVPLPVNEEEVEATSIHITEVLRVAIPPAKPETVPIPVQSATPTRRFSDGITAGFSASVLFGDLSSPPQIGFQPGVGYQFHEWFSVRITALIPIRSMQFDEPEGDVGIHAGAIDASLAFMRDRGRFRPVLRLGYQLWLFRATVSAENGFEEHPGTEFTSGPTCFAGAVVAIQRRLGLELGVGISTTLAALQYEVAGEMIAEVGRPMLDISLGLVILPKERR